MTTVEMIVDKGEVVEHDELQGLDPGTLLLDPDDEIMLVVQNCLNENIVVHIDGCFTEFGDQEKYFPATRMLAGQGVSLIQD